MKKEKFDIIVIGAGSGGLNIAGFMNKAGFKVLLIDKSDKNIGGDCLNFGCVPSKALIHLAKTAKSAKDAKNIGLHISGSIDMKKVSAYITKKRNIIRTHENATYFRKIGMTVMLGEAKFSSKNSVKVNNKEYTAKKIILATGSRPRQLNIKGIETLRYSKDLFNNENIFKMKTLPKKLVVIGGGPIGVELSQALNRLGSNVSIINSGPQLLPKEDPEISNILYKELIKEGITVHVNSKPTQIKNKKSIVINNNGKKETLRFDAILVSIGRELNTDVGLEKANIKINNNGKIIVDGYLRTTNKNILVCGDIAGSYQFTHAAELHAGVIINNFFSPFKKKVNYDNLSWVTFTDPEIATFGLNEKQLQERNIPYQKITEDVTDDDRAIVDDANTGKIIVYISKNKIVGGTLITKNAGEIFQELILAKQEKLNITSLFNKIYPYPTASRINKRVITTLFSKKLTATSKKILKFMYH